MVSLAPENSGALFLPPPTLPCPAAPTARVLLAGLPRRPAARQRRESRAPAPWEPRPEAKSGERRGAVGAE